MIFIREKKSDEWTMTAKEAMLLSKELAYIAEEANDHQHPYPSTMILEGCEKTLSISVHKEFRIIAIPDKIDIPNSEEKEKNE